MKAFVAAAALAATVFTSAGAWAYDSPANRPTDPEARDQYEAQHVRRGQYHPVEASDYTIEPRAQATSHTKPATAPREASRSFFSHDGTKQY